MSHLERICVAVRMDELGLEKRSFQMQRLIYVTQEEQESILDHFFLGGWEWFQYEKERWVSRLCHCFAMFFNLIISVLQNQHFSSSEECGMCQEVCGFKMGDCFGLACRFRSI